MLPFLRPPKTRNDTDKLMVKFLRTLWWSYAVVGAIWLTFTLISVFFLNPRTTYSVDGVVKEVITAEWDGYYDDIALIQTDDSNGNVLARDYGGRARVGDQVSLSISTGGASGSFIFTTVDNRRKPRRK